MDGHHSQLERCTVTVMMMILKGELLEKVLFSVYTSLLHGSFSLIPLVLTRTEVVLGGMCYNIHIVIKS